MNIAEDIFSHASPSAVAIIDKGVFYSYSDLDCASKSVAAQLRNDFLGKPAVRIGLRCPDGAAYVALAMGILRAGACFVPLAPELSKMETAALLAELCVDGVLTSTGEFGKDFAYSLEKIDHNVVFSCAEALAALNPAFIRFSSGTTGASKGIVLSHETLLQRIQAANAGLQICPRDRVLWVLSMSHHFAVSIVLYLWNGATVVLPESHLAGDILTAANAHGATVFYAAPFHYNLLASAEGEVAWRSLRLAVSTTAQLPPATGEAFAKAYGQYPAQALGIIEVGLPFLNDQNPKLHPNSIGQPQPAYEYRLRGASEADASGELLIKGPGLFDAYITPWQTREEVLLDGEWFCTGDIARVDAEGYLYLQGRNKALIIVGGMKFFPEEVEAVLCAHPGVTEARVLGREHPTFGTVPIAEIVAAGEPTVSRIELNSHCRKHLARYKIPIEFRFVENLPKTPSGKIQRI